MTDLIIGAADLYNWEQINNWAKSIRMSGFDGDVALLLYRSTESARLDITENTKPLNIDVYLVEHDNFGRLINHTDRGRDTQSHQMRFFHIWQLLDKQDFRYVIVTDVRDVIFQDNPTTW